MPRYPQCRGVQRGRRDSTEGKRCAGELGKALRERERKFQGGIEEEEAHPTPPL